MNFNTFKVPAFIFVILSLFLVSCDDNNTQRIDYSTVPGPYSIEGAEEVTTESGLTYYIIEEGVCPSEDEELCTVNSRDQVSIYYTKRVSDDQDRIISSSYVNGVERPVTTTVTSGNIIAEEGFRQGILGMKAGEKRVLLLPPDLAYGSTNSQYADKTIWIDLEIDEIVY